MLAWMPDSAFQLDEDKVVQNISKARQRAALGFSGMTEFVLPTGILDRGDISPNAWGGMSALRKVDGGMPGKVVGDTLRRLVARTIAQQIGDAVE